MIIKLKWKIRGETYRGDIHWLSGSNYLREILNCISYIWIFISIFIWINCIIHNSLTNLKASEQYCKIVIISFQLLSKKKIQILYSNLPQKNWSAYENFWHSYACGHISANVLKINWNNFCCLYLKHFCISANYSYESN